VAFKPSDKRKREEEDLDLNITPIMNLMVVLIPLLLSAAKFTQLALLEYLPPAEAASSESAPPGETKGGAGEEISLNLLVNLAEPASRSACISRWMLDPISLKFPKKTDCTTGLC